MKKVLFKVIVPAVIIAVWMLTCYPVCNKAEGLVFILDYSRVSVWYPPDVPMADTKEFRYQWEHWRFCFELHHRRTDWRRGAYF